MKVKTSKTSIFNIFTFKLKCGISIEKVYYRKNNELYSNKVYLKNIIYKCAFCKEEYTLDNEYIKTLEAIKMQKLGLLYCCNCFPIFSRND